MLLPWGTGCSGKPDHGVDLVHQGASLGLEEDVDAREPVRDGAEAHRLAADASAVSGRDRRRYEGLRAVTDVLVLVVVEFARGDQLPTTDTSFSLCEYPTSLAAQIASSDAFESSVGLGNRGVEAVRGLHLA